MPEITKIGSLLTELFKKNINVITVFETWHKYGQQGMQQLPAPTITMRYENMTNQRSGQHLQITTTEGCR